jgi:uncharacterized protein (TIGR00661 family)
MKILYAIQGTGNGHISRARDIIPELMKHGDVDVLVSGIQSDVFIPYPIKFRLHGMGFMFGKKGGVDLFQTFRKCVSRKFLQEVKTLPVEHYNLVVNDFEPVSAWACKLKKVPCIGLSHQYAVLAQGAPLPHESDLIGKWILKNYAPIQKGFGFHFEQYAENIFTPVIRQQVRDLEVENHGHFTVYLPAYDEEKLVKQFSKIRHVEWHVFSKHSKTASIHKNVQVFPIENFAFIKSMSLAEGVLCGAGFETPAEALFLGKKLMAIPMKNQFEQQCNAAALAKLGVPIVNSMKKKHLPSIEDWINKGSVIQVDYPNKTAEIVNHVIAEFHQNQSLSLVKQLISA